MWKSHPLKRTQHNQFLKDTVRNFKNFNKKLFIKLIRPSNSVTVVSITFYYSVYKIILQKLNIYIFPFFYNTNMQF